MNITILGSGTSTGIPVPGCHCDVCQSPEPKNNRLRTSILITVLSEELSPEARGRHPNGLNILVDSAPDLRTQALRYGIETVDAVLYTHSHADHIFGLDDLRCFNFVRRGPLPVFANSQTADELERIFRYAFFPDPNYRGGSPPQLALTRVSPGQSFQIADVSILPVALEHGNLPILGFRVGNFAYLTDCSLIPDTSKRLLRDLDVLVLDGLRDRPHPTHFTQEQAVREAEELAPKHTFLTHISHDLDHHQANARLRKLTHRNIELAWDGLSINVGLKIAQRD